MHLAVTCHLLFWQNNQDLLLATAAIRGWNDTKIRISQKVNPGGEHFPASPARTWTCNLSITNLVFYRWPIPTPQYSTASKLVTIQCWTKGWVHITASKLVTIQHWNKGWVHNTAGKLVTIQHWNKDWVHDTARYLSQYSTEPRAECTTQLVNLSQYNTASKFVIIQHWNKG